MQKILLSLAGLAVIAFIIYTQYGKEQNRDKPSIPVIEKVEKEDKAIVAKEETIKASIAIPIKEKEEIPSMEDIDADIMIERKKILATLHPRVMKTMQAIPACLENAENKAEAFDCGKKFRDVNEELDFVMGEISEEAPIEGYDANFTWNEETKTKMIKEIEGSVAPMEEIHTCIRAANSEKEISECFEKIVN